MEKKSAKILLYPVSIETCEEGGFFADCSTFQGCHVEGDTYPEVIENIEDAIKAHIEIRKEHNEFVPSVVVEDKTKIDINFPIFVKA
jgi:predicted RNase H-like HicB family nuclease